MLEISRGALLAEIRSLREQLAERTAQRDAAEAPRGEPLIRDYVRSEFDRAWALIGDLRAENERLRAACQMEFRRYTSTLETLIEWCEAENPLREAWKGELRGAVAMSESIPKVGDYKPLEPDAALAAPTETGIPT